MRQFPASEKQAQALPRSLRFLLDHPILSTMGGAGLYYALRNPEFPGLNMEARPDFRTRAGYPQEYDMPIQLKTAEEFAKEAGGAWGQGIKKIIESGIEAILQNPGKTLGIGAGLTGIGLASDLLEPTVDTLAYRLQRLTQPLESRIKLPDILGEAASKGLGNEGTKSLLGLAADIFQKATGGVGGAFAATQRSGILKGLLKDDPVLANAQPSELMKHYNTMAKFAPTLASDESAARSFLREAIMSQAGPDYSTISGLARAESTVQQALNPMRK